MKGIKISTWVIIGLMTTGVSITGAPDPNNTGSSLDSKLDEFPGKKEEPDTPEAKAMKQRNTKSYELWYNPDYRPYDKSFYNLLKLSHNFARNKFRLALSNFQSGRNILFKMREEVQRYERENKEAYHLNEKWYWQTIDRVNKEQRVIHRKKREAKLAAVTYFTRAIRHLDEITNKEYIQHPQYKELLASIYRWWAINQYDLGNIPQCIDILERYINLAPRYEEEFPAHKYLASSYAFKEAMIRKYKVASEQQMEWYKRKKNEHLLRATELRYGKDTPEYKEIVRLVNRDEVIAIRP